MSAGSVRALPQQDPLYLPPEWTATPPAPDRDVALDLLRGLAMAILVVNHTALESPLRDATGALLSAAEVLVMVSGVVAGMVFGRRWLRHGGRATSLMLLRRARKLYVASVAVVALVGAATLVPWLASDALTVSPNVVPAVDAYAYDGTLRTLLAIVTLEAGPWQFTIMGFFVAVLALAPAVLWALDRGWWLPVVVASCAVYLLGRAWAVDVLPAQSERPFPLMVWQLLFVGGLVLGWHRDRVAAWVSGRRRAVVATVAALAVVLAAARLSGPSIWGGDAWAGFEAAHLDKGTLDVLRIGLMVALTAALYLALRRCAERAERLLGPVLLPLGRNSFYVFIMHVFVCLALASAVVALGGALSPAANAALQLGCLALLLVLVRRRVLFRWVPR
ncbi:MAG TPA: OpgC domain-containing protein [Capillimicrobium sp.]|nr:OpgC domain-containing protein [Capillimicrobium sp.]